MSGPPGRPGDGAGSETWTLTTLCRRRPSETRERLHPRKREGRKQEKAAAVVGAGFEFPVWLDVIYYLNVTIPGMASGVRRE